MKRKGVIFDQDAVVNLLLLEKYLKFPRPTLDCSNIDSNSSRASYTRITLVKLLEGNSLNSIHTLSSDNSKRKIHNKHQFIDSNLYEMIDSLLTKEVSESRTDEDIWFSDIE